MKRREFVKVAAGGIAAATLSAGPMACGPDPFLRWTWVHGGGDRTLPDWREQYGRLAEAGFHGVLVGGGETELHAEAAHAAGLEFHRWVWTLNRNGDQWVKENHPEWFTISREGNSSFTHPPYVDYYRWLCPTKPEVREYLRASIQEIGRDPDVDGVHLDYVRHCDVILPSGLWATYDLIQDREYPEFDFCYCDTCRDEFESTHGMDPLDLPDPTADDRWRRFRWDGVTKLVETLADSVHQIPASPFGSTLSGPGGQKPISAAVFPSPTIARKLVRQAWDEWPVDAVFPMLYQGFYEEKLPWIGDGIREGLEALRSRGEGQPKPGGLFAGLYLPSLNSQERESAVRIAQAAGARGVSFFEMNGLEL